MRLCGAKRLAKQAVRVTRRRKSSAEGINGSQFKVAIELLAESHACSPAAGRPAVVSKTGGKIILKIVSRGQVAAPGEDGYVPVVIMEASDLKVPASADLSLRGNLFVPAILQKGSPLPPEQRGKGIEFIESGRKGAPGLSVIRIEWTRSVGQGGEDEGRAPIIGEAHTQFCRWPEGRGCGPESHQNIFAAISQHRAISEGERATLIKTNTPEDRPDRPQFGFAKDQRRMRAGAERSCRQPYRGDGAAGGIAIIVHLSGQDHSAPDS